MTDLYSFGTPFGGVKVAKEASEDFQGLIEELAQAGAPIKNIGSYNYRNIAGTNVLSEHGKGKAIDIGDQQARNVVDPAFRDWVEENPQRYSQILAKYNMRGGETFSNPDLGHVEWKGEGYGNPLREAAPIGGAMPENYDTEDRTAAGIGLVPKTEDVATGPKRMANGDGPQGILGALGMQNQQPQGLLGALGDPETMAYIGMVLKGMNPYSQIDPNSMLSSAHTNAVRRQALMQQQAEQARDNARADERLGFDRERFNLTKSEHEAQRTQAEQERKAREDFYSGRAGAPPSTDVGAPPPTAGAPAEVGAPPSTEAGVPPAQPTPPVSEYDKIRAQIKYYEDNMGRLGQKDQLAAQKQIELLNKRLTPSATELKLNEAASSNLPQLESLKADLERAKELVPKAASNSVTTFFDKLASNLGETIAGPQAMATAELDRKMRAIGLTELRKLLPGPASNKDVAIINDISANPGMSPQEKIAKIGGVLQRVEAQIAKDKETIKRFRQKEGTYKPEDDTPSSGGGGTAIGGGWTVREK